MIGSTPFEQPKPDKPTSEAQLAPAPLLAAVHELESEIFGGKLNFREVPTDTFVAWYQWRLKNQPNTDTGIPLKDFDIESAMMFFEDFVKAANRLLSASAVKPLPLGMGI